MHVGAVPNLVVVERVTHVVVEHAVVVRVIETAQRQNHDRFGVEILRIVPQVGVVVADGRCAVGAVGVGDVRILRDLVQLVALHVAECAREVELQILEDRPVEFALELGIHHVQLDLVVGQLVEDVERSVVHLDVLQIAVVVVGTHGARGVERVAEGVDVELARPFARHGVHFARVGTRSLLVAERSHGLHADRDLVADGVVVAEVERVAAHLVGHRPAVVAQEADRGVGARPVGTRRDAQRVLLLEVVREEFVEPVGVGLGVFEQEGLACAARVYQAEFAVLLVVGRDGFPHQTVGAVARGVENALVEHTLAGDFGGDGHLVGRIEDVVVRVAGLGADREVAGVVDARRTLLTLLGGDDHHAVHGAGAVESRRRGVLEDVEGLDVRGVDTRHRRTQQRRGVARRQLVVGDVDHVLEHYAVDDPQRFVLAAERRHAADTHLRGAAEGARYVLNRYAGHLSFEHAAHVRNARDGHVIGRNLDRRAGETLFLCVLETRHDDIVDADGRFLQLDVDDVIFADRHVQGFVSHVGERQHRMLAGRSGNRKYVGSVYERCDARGRADHDGGADDRLSVFGINNLSRDLYLCERRADGAQTEYEQ